MNIDLFGNVSPFSKMSYMNNAVYKYTDMDDGKVKYVGIIYKGTLPNRHKQHTREEWYKKGNYLLEYIEVNNQSESESIESHLIALYETYNYYNKAKKDWGINSYLPNEYEWCPVIPTCEDIIKTVDYSLKYDKTLSSTKYRLEEIEEIMRYMLIANNYLRYRSENG